MASKFAKRAPKFELHLILISVSETINQIETKIGQNLAYYLET